jgi:hypothetical protein
LILFLYYVILKMLLKRMKDVPMTEPQMARLQAGFTRLSREHRRVILGEAEALVFAEASRQGDRHPAQSEQGLGGEPECLRTEERGMVV